MLQISKLVIDSLNLDHLLVSSDLGQVETENDGQMWQQITQVHGLANFLVATQGISSRTCTILWATDQGSYRSVAEPGHMARSRLPLSTTLALTYLTLSAGGSVLSALSGSDLWFLPNLGTGWFRCWHFARGDPAALVINLDKTQELLAGFFWPGQVLISTNLGIFWFPLPD